MKDTDDALISRLGGHEAVAAAMGENPLTVKKWRWRGIPWGKRAAFQQAARTLRKRLPSSFMSERQVNKAA